MYNQGDILLIPIPFSDLKTSKKRPVLVLSNSDYNSNNQDIVFLIHAQRLTTPVGHTEGVPGLPQVLR